MPRIIDISNDPKTGRTRKVSIEGTRNKEVQKEYHIAYIVRSFDGEVKYPMKGAMYVVPNYEAIIELIDSLGEETAIAQLIGEMDNTDLFNNL